jgi:hypothetical protein
MLKLFNFIFLLLFFNISFGQVNDNINGKIYTSNRDYTIDLVNTSLDTFPNVQLIFKLQDKYRKPIWNLKLSDLAVTENNKNCKLNDLRGLTAQTTLKINLIIDKSTSMLLDENLMINQFGEVIYYNPERYNPPIEHAKRAAINFIEKFNTSKEYFAFTTFSDNVKVVNQYTLDRTSIVSEIRKLEANGSTSLYDAICNSAMSSNSDTLYINILLTDGEDTNSKNSFDTALARVKKSNSIYYIIGLGNVDSNKLVEFANVSNGEYYSVNNAEFLNNIYNRIYDNIASYYVLDFTSDNISSIDTSVNYTISYTSNNLSYKDSIGIRVPENVLNYIKTKNNITYSLGSAIVVVAIGTSVFVLRRRRKLYNT